MPIDEKAAVRIEEAAAYLHEVGWTTGTMRSSVTGAVCLLGALAHAPGDKSRAGHAEGVVSRFLLEKVGDRGVARFNDRLCASACEAEQTLYLAADYARQNPQS